MTYVTEARFENGQSINEHYEIQGVSSRYSHCDQPMQIWTSYEWDRIRGTKYGVKHYHCDVCNFDAKSASEIAATRLFKPMKPKIKIMTSKIKIKIFKR